MEVTVLPVNLSTTVSRFRCLIALVTFLLPGAAQAVVTFMRIYDCGDMIILVPTADHGCINQQLIKFDSTGNKEWVARFNWQALYNWRWATTASVATAADSNYIVGGAFNDSITGEGFCDAMIFKLKANGQAILWMTTLRGRGGISDVYDIVPTADGGCLAMGEAAGRFVARLNRDGTVRWISYWGRCDPYFLEMTQDSGCVAVGWGYEYVGEDTIVDFYKLVRFDSAGNLLWERKRKASWGNFHFHWPHVAILADGNIAVGVTEWTMRQDSLWYDIDIYDSETGNLLSQRRLFPWREPESDGLTYIRKILPTPDTGCVLAGQIVGSYTNTNYRIAMFKLNRNFEVCWLRQYKFKSQPPETPFYEFLDGFIAHDGGYVLGGVLQGRGNWPFIIKTDSLGFLHWDEAGLRGTHNQRLEVEEEFEPAGSGVIPAIVRGVLYLPERAGVAGKPVLVDITGRRVLELVPGANDVRGLVPGVYFIRSNAGVERKVVIAR
ncbi:MAG: hypothetical protein ABIK48_06935 [candidate division WOR-3 bacterium]